MTPLFYHGAHSTEKHQKRPINGQNLERNSRALTIINEVSELSVYESIIPVIDPPSLEEGMAFESQSTYRLIRRLGRGGTGEVWLAERISAGNHSQKVAIKFLFDAHAGRSLAREALRMSHLAHDNIVPFVDSGRDSGGRYFVAMAYMKGVDLEGLRNMVGLSPDAVYGGEPEFRIPQKIVGFMMFMVLRGLGYAHEYEFDDGTVGLIHRDVSPGNILVDEGKGFVKLTDFGVAARQSSERPDIEIAGKVPYMAPEVLTEGLVDARSDLYSLGLVVYELLTGFNPNVVTSRVTNIIGAITAAMLAIEKPLRPPVEVVEGIDDALSDIVARMLASDPGDRYSSAEEVIADLSYYLYSSGVGPNTASVVSYLKLVRNPGLQPTIRDKNALPFLRRADGGLNVRPPFRLTEAAREDVGLCRTPGRIWE
jgi:serine/threonine protein kinase